MRILKYIMIALSVILISAYSILQISKSRTFQFFGGIVKSVETDKKIVALTFDDGPIKKTDEIISILEELDIKATFFVTGSELEKNINEGKKLVQAGYELGNHSFSHKRMVFKSLGFIKSEIERTNKLIRETGYTGPIHFRPPYFKKFLVLPYYLSKTNTRTILCDIEPETFLSNSADFREISDYTIKNTKNGSIILLHIMYNTREESRKALTPIVNELRSKGYEFVTVSQLLENKI